MADTHQTPINPAADVYSSPLKSMTAGEAEEHIAGQQKIFDCLRKLLDQQIHDQEIAENLQEKISLAQFLRWGHAWVKANAAKLSDWRNHWDVDEDTWRYVLGLLHEMYPAYVLYLHWPLVVLGRRPNKHPVVAFTMQVFVKFADVEGELPVETARAAIIEPVDLSLNDGSIMALMRLSAHQFSNEVSVVGLDKLYDQELAERKELLAAGKPLPPSAFEKQAPPPSSNGNKII